MATNISGISYVFDTKLQSNSTRSYQYLIIKTLIGSSSIEYRGSRLKQKINYSVLPQSIQTKRGSKAFSDFLNKFSVDVNEAEFVRRTTTSNRRFYHEILIEFSHYFIETRRNCHTVAFAHLYRLLERIAFSAPLLYCRSSNDYYGTFTEMKKLFTGMDQSGELGFLRKFLDQGKLIDKVLLDFTYRIDFSGLADRTLHWSALSNIFAKFETSDISTHHFEIKFREVCNLTTTIRNRFFHLRTGDDQRNISIMDLGDPNDFFSEINRTVSSFIAIVVLHCATEL